MAWRKEGYPTPTIATREFKDEVNAVVRLALTDEEAFYKRMEELDVEYPEVAVAAIWELIALGTPFHRMERIPLRLRQKATLYGVNPALANVTPMRFVNMATTAPEPTEVEQLESIIAGLNTSVGKVPEYLAARIGTNLYKIAPALEKLGKVFDKLDDYNLITRAWANGKALSKYIPNTSLLIWSGASAAGGAYYMPDPKLVEGAVREQRKLQDNPYAQEKLSEELKKANEDPSGYSLYNESGQMDMTFLAIQILSDFTPFSAYFWIGHGWGGLLRLTARLAPLKVAAIAGVFSKEARSVVFARAMRTASLEKTAETGVRIMRVANAARHEALNAAGLSKAEVEGLIKGGVAVSETVLETTPGLSEELLARAAKNAKRYKQTGKILDTLNPAIPLPQTAVEKYTTATVDTVSIALANQAAISGTPQEFVAYAKAFFKKAAEDPDWFKGQHHLLGTVLGEDALWALNYSLRRAGGMEYVDDLLRMAEQAAETTLNATTKEQFVSSVANQIARGKGEEALKAARAVAEHWAEMDVQKRAMYAAMAVVHDGISQTTERVMRELFGGPRLMPRALRVLHSGLSFIYLFLNPKYAIRNVGNNLFMMWVDGALYGGNVAHAAEQLATEFGGHIPSGAKRGFGAVGGSLGGGGTRAILETYEFLYYLKHPRRLVRDVFRVIKKDKAVARSVAGTGTAGLAAYAESICRFTAVLKGRAEFMASIADDLIKTAAEYGIDPTLARSVVDGLVAGLPHEVLNRVADTEVGAELLEHYLKSRLPTAWLTLQEVVAAESKEAALKAIEATEQRLDKAIAKAAPQVADILQSGVSHFDDLNALSEGLFYSIFGEKSAAKIGRAANHEMDDILQKTAHTIIEHSKKILQKGAEKEQLADAIASVHDMLTRTKGLFDGMADTVAAMRGTAEKTGEYVSNIATGRIYTTQRKFIKEAEDILNAYGQKWGVGKIDGALHAASETRPGQHTYYLAQTWAHITETVRDTLEGAWQRRYISKEVYDKVKSILAAEIPEGELYGEARIRQVREAWDNLVDGVVSEQRSRTALRREVVEEVSQVMEKEIIDEASLRGFSKYLYDEGIKVQKTYAAVPGIGPQAPRPQYAHLPRAQNVQMAKDALERAGGSPVQLIYDNGEIQKFASGMEAKAAFAAMGEEAQRAVVGIRGQTGGKWKWLHKIDSAADYERVPWGYGTTPQDDIIGYADKVIANAREQGARGPLRRDLIPEDVRNLVAVTDDGEWWVFGEDVLTPPSAMSRLSAEVPIEIVNLTRGSKTATYRLRSVKGVFRATADDAAAIASGSAVKPASEIAPIWTIEPITYETKVVRETVKTPVKRVVQEANEAIDWLKGSGMELLDSLLSSPNRPAVARVRATMQNLINIAEAMDSPLPESLMLAWDNFMAKSGKAGGAEAFDALVAEMERAGIKVSGLTKTKSGTWEIFNVQHAQRAANRLVSDALTRMGRTDIIGEMQKAIRLREGREAAIWALLGNDSDAVRTFLSHIADAAEEMQAAVGLRKVLDEAIVRTLDDVGKIEFREFLSLPKEARDKIAESLARAARHTGDEIWKPAEYGWQLVMKPATPEARGAIIQYAKEHAMSVAEAGDNLIIVAGPRDVADVAVVDISRRFGEALAEFPADVGPTLSLSDRILARYAPDAIIGAGDITLTKEAFESLVATNVKNGFFSGTDILVRDSNPIREAWDVIKDVMTGGGQVSPATQAIVRDQGLRDWLHELKQIVADADETFWKMRDPKYSAQVERIIELAEPAQYAALKFGESLADFALHNYGALYQGDFWLRFLFLYPYWHTRMIPKWIARILRHPQYLTTYMRYQMALEYANRDLPPKYQDKVHIRLGGLDLAVAFEDFLNPLGQLTSSYINQAWEETPEGRIYQRLTSWGPSPWPYFVILGNAWFLKDPRKGYITMWPHSQLIRSLTAWLRAEKGFDFGGIVPPGGLDIESTTYPFVNIFRQKDKPAVFDKPNVNTYTAQMLYRWQMDGTCTPEEAQKALAERDGNRLWDKAKDAAIAERLWPASSLLTGLSIYSIGPEEYEINKAWAIWRQLQAAHLSGKEWDAAMEKFQKRFPFFLQYKTIYSEPEAALEQYLTTLMYTRYSELKAKRDMALSQCRVGDKVCADAAHEEFETEWEKARKEIYPDFQFLEDKHPDQWMLEYKRFEFLYKPLLATRPVYGKYLTKEQREMYKKRKVPVFDDYTDYSLAIAIWERKLPQTAKSLPQWQMEAGRIARHHPDIVTPQEAMQGLLSYATIDHIRRWQAMDDNIFSAITKVYLENYYEKQWPRIEAGLPALPPPTPKQIVKWVKGEYGDKFTEKQIYNAMPGSPLSPLSFDERQMVIDPDRWYQLQLQAQFWQVYNEWDKERKKKGIKMDTKHNQLHKDILAALMGKGLRQDISIERWQYLIRGMGADPLPSPKVLYERLYIK